LQTLFTDPKVSNVKIKAKRFSLKLDEIYIKFIIDSHHMHKGKQKISAKNTRKVSVLASLKLSIEHRWIWQQLFLHNKRHPSAHIFF
jgi:hypothetical protein